jgi:hypothetical protein
MGTILSMFSKNFREKDYGLSEILNAQNFSITTGGPSQDISKSTIP